MAHAAHAVKNPSSKIELSRRLSEISREQRTLIKQLRKATLAPHQPLWTVIQGLLIASNGTLSIERIVEHLIDENHDLGKYPLRTVTQSICSPYTSGIFQIVERKDSKTGQIYKMVTLREQAVRYQPIAQQRQATREGSGARA